MAMSNQEEVSFLCIASKSNALYINILVDGIYNMCLLSMKLTKDQIKINSSYITMGERKGTEQS